MPPPLVLIVDDDAELSTMLVRLLQAEGWAAQTDSPPPQRTGLSRNSHPTCCCST